MRLRFICIISLAIIGCDPDTSSSPEPEDVFVKLYGHDGTETAADFVVRRDVDGVPTGYVLFGTTNSAFLRQSESVGRDFLLISTDPAGNGQVGFAGMSANGTFSRNYGLRIPNIVSGDSVTVTLEAAKVIQTADDGFLMVGTALSLLDTTQNGDENNVDRAYLVKVATDGTPEWSILYPSISANTVTTKNPNEESSVSVSDVIQTSDGNILVIGSTTDINTTKPDLPNPALDLRDIWLLKFDPTGLDLSSTDLPVENINFERVLGFPGEDFGKAVFERSDQSLVIVGNGQGKSDGVDRDILFITSDADAFNNNFQEIGSVDENGVAQEDFVNEVVLLSNNGVAVVGYASLPSGTRDNTLIARFDPGGALDFIETVRLPDEGLSDNDALSDDNINLNGSHRAFGVTETLSGDLVVVGEIEGVDVSIDAINNQPGRSNDILLLTTDGFGQRTDQEITKNFGGVNNDIGEAVEQIIDADGTARFVILSTVDFEGGSTMISLMKTSSSGNLIR